MKPAPRWALPSVRPLLDQEVDRAQVQARRRAQPSATNRPRPSPLCEGGTPGRARHFPGRSSSVAVRPPGRPKRAPHRSTCGQRPSRAGGPGGGVPPGPVPNPEVKPARAEGTAGAGPWENRAPPPREGRWKTCFGIKAGLVRPFFVYRLFCRCALCGSDPCFMCRWYSLSERFFL